MDEQEALLFELPLGDEPPSEFRLFGAGMNSTDKGEFLFDEKAAESVMGRFKQKGKDRLEFDVHHQSLTSGNHPDSYKAKGWFVPEVRLGESGPELWASKVEWTPKTEQEIRDREFRFFSPAILFEGASRRITRLRNVALTNTPATNDQRPLVLSEDSEPEQEKENEMKEILAALSAVDESTALARVAELSEFESKVSELETKLSEAEAQLSEMKAAQAKERRAAAIKSLNDEMRLRPAQNEFAASLSDEQFEAFASTLTPMAKPVEEQEELSEGDRRVDGADFNVEEML